MNDPSSTDLVPATPTLEDTSPSSGVRDALRRGTEAAGIDRKNLLAQIGGGVPMSSQQRKKLAIQATDEIVSLLPTGEVYVSGGHWREVMNDVFGPMQWGLVSPNESLYEPAPPDAPKGVKSMLYLEVFLIVKGRCVANAIGAQEYFPESRRMTKDDAIEGCRTNGLMRCLKNFGVYGNLWNAKWATPARARVGVRVTVSDGWPRQQWRRVDAPPLESETGLAPGSPNADLYVGPRQQQQGRAQPERRPERPAPAAQAKPIDVETVEKGGLDDPARILTIRPRRYKDTRTEEMVTMWVVGTDLVEYVTNDENMVRALEGVKAQNKRVRIHHEILRSSHGTAKRILEYTVVD